MRDRFIGLLPLLPRILIAALIVEIARWLRRQPQVEPRPRHLDPAICHQGWCPTTRTGQPDDCDCTAEWLAA